MYTYIISYIPIQKEYFNELYTYRGNIILVQRIAMYLTTHGRSNIMYTYMYIYSIF